MKILLGTKARGLEDAVVLAFQEAGAADMSAGLVELFASFTDSTELQTDAEKEISSTIRGRYRGNTSWEGKQWYVPIPKLGYDTRVTAQVMVEVNTYLVAAVEVETIDRYYWVTLVGAVGKPETLVIPVVFLQAILTGDLGRFGILARSGSRTTWEIPGGKPVQLPDDFVNKLCKMLESKSVTMWLNEFGHQGRSVAPLVGGSLLGLQFQESTPPVPVAKQVWTTKQLVSALEGMAYQRTEAMQMVNRAAPYLRAENTLEEAVRIVLQQSGKGGYQ